MSPGGRAAGERTPIGRPISGVRPRVIDEGGELVPVGVPGELLIGVSRWRVGMRAVLAWRHGRSSPIGGRRVRVAAAWILSVPPLFPSWSEGVRYRCPHQR